MEWTDHTPKPTALRMVTGPVSFVGHLPPVTTMVTRSLQPLQGLRLVNGPSNFGVRDPLPSTSRQLPPGQGSSDPPWRSKAEEDKRSKEVLVWDVGSDRVRTSQRLGLSSNPPRKTTLRISQIFSSDLLTSSGSNLHGWSGVPWHDGTVVQ